MWGQPQSALPPLCPPSGLSVAFSLSLLLHLSIAASLVFFIFHHSPFLSLPILQDHFQLLCSLHVRPCKCAHANTVVRAHTHTPLCLYLVIGSITGDIFPDNATEGGEPGKAEWEGGDLSISHLMEATVLALPLTEMNEFNISPFWSTDDLLMQLSVSIAGGLPFFSSLCAWILETHRKTFEGILTETNSFCGLTWLLYIFVHIGADPPPQHFYDYEIALIMGLDVCVQL